MPRWLLEASVVGVGGFLGSTLRYGVGVLVHRFVRFASIPWETLTVNVVGCLAIGALAGATESGEILRPELRLFLGVGLLGGFTTLLLPGAFRDSVLIRGRFQGDRSPANDTFNSNSYRRPLGPT